jgi:hypothetical protein
MHAPSGDYVVDDAGEDCKVSEREESGISEPTNNPEGQARDGGIEERNRCEKH